MPLYQYLCKDGHLTEIYQHDPNPQETRFCEFYIDEDYTCAEECKLQISLVTMKPDSHWSGTQVADDRIVYSEKEYKEVMGNVEPVTRDRIEYVKKRKQQVRNEIEQKKEERKDKFFKNLSHSIDLPE